MHLNKETKLTPEEYKKLINEGKSLITRTSPLKLKKEEYLKYLDETSNKELLSNLKVDHYPIYTEKDITPENEKWVRVLMKADKIFERLQ